MQEKIEIDINEFSACFPAIAAQYPTNEALQKAINCSYKGIGSIISPYIGSINLDIEMQERAVYLAVAHKMYLSLNPDAFRPVASVGQGSENVSFSQAVVKDNLDYYLSSSPYGVELLAIIASIQPLPIDTPLNIFPNYF